ncbi:response regulator transcription factor [Paenibacillus sp. UNC451MF]|uniref:response regulator transcription factor n=1 Tax=Paenibacillus sp. UNC451MF TaxID=1449063 RepID=UPI00048D651F|nr:response regulator [Paenibacillus sp. UNC451MF]
MINVLIVDDFQVDRDNLKQLLKNDPAFSHVNVVAACENGKEALEYMQNLQPDILITDIEMPVMNGFELVRTVRQLYPQIKIIFSSVYNEFEYAKNALYLGGYGYLLKPVAAEELLQCVSTVSDELANDLKARKDYELLYRQLVENKPYLIENLMISLIYGTAGDMARVQERLELLELKLSDCRFVIALIEIDGFSQLTREMNIEEKHLFQMMILSRIRCALGAVGNYIAVPLQAAHIGIIFYEQGEDQLSVRLRHIHSLLNGIQLEFGNSDISISIAVSGYSNDIVCIKFLYEQCLYILRYKYLLGKGKVMYTSDIPASKEKPLWDYNGIEKEMRILLNTGSSEDIRAYVGRLADGMTDNSSPEELKSFFYFLMICLQNIVSANPEGFTGHAELTSPSAWEVLLGLETISDAIAWIQERLLFVNKCIREREFHKNKAVVDKIKRFVEQHYRSNITLEILSEEFYYSPNYLNQIFKLETGRTILDHVTRFKMEKAKEMLMDKQFKLYEIAEQLGYQHTAYFSSLFKKFTGITPKDFRRQLEI